MSATRPASASSSATTATSSRADTTYTGPDRRRSARQPHFVAATMQPPSGNAEVDEAVMVCDLSLGGVGLLCDHRYRLGTVWRITLGNGPLFLNAKVKVVSCRSRGDGRYDVGCAFC